RLLAPLAREPPRPHGHRGRRSARAGIQEQLELVTQRLGPRRLVSFRRSIKRVPDPVFLDVTISEDLDLPRAEVTREGLLLAHDHAVTEGAGGEVAGLDESGNVTVLDGTEANVVHAPAEEIAKGRRHRGGVLLEEAGEEIEVGDATP